jgi:hypothetical protein
MKITWSLALQAPAAIFSQCMVMNCSRLLISYFLPPHKTGAVYQDFLQNSLSKAVVICGPAD